MAFQTHVINLIMKLEFMNMSRVLAGNSKLFRPRLPLAPDLATTLRKVI